MIRLWRTNPLHGIVLTRGQGCTVWDAAGRPYLDLVAGTWCNILGYGHPTWAEAIREQLSRLTHVGSPFSAVEVDEALSKLHEILPPALNRVVLLNTGSEAVELALKMARAATGARRIAVFEKGYYGATTCALSLSEAGRSAAYLPQVEGVLRLPAPHCSRCPIGASWPCEDFACLGPLCDLTREKAALAAVLYEPIMAGGGVIVPPPGYGARLRELASRCAAVLIAEEVTTGVGRTGRWFGFEHDEIVPDILVIGKAVGAGLPVAVVATTKDVEARCRGLLRHVQSHQNDPFSGRVAATVISILQDERLLEKALERGAQLLDGLRSCRAPAPIQEVRGKGLMVGIELSEEVPGIGESLAKRLLDKGFIVDYQASSSTVRLFPPYIITQSEIDLFLEAFHRTLAAATEG